MMKIKGLFNRRFFGRVLTAFNAVILFNFSLYAGMPTGPLSITSPDILPSARFLGPAAKNEVVVALPEDDSVAAEVGAQFVVSPIKEKVRLEVRRGDGNGPVVRNLGRGEGLGENLVARWNLKDARGRLVSPGTYVLAIFGDDKKSPVLATSRVQVVVKKGLFAGLPFGDLRAQPLAFRMQGLPGASESSSSPNLQVNVSLGSPSGVALSTNALPFYVPVAEGAGSYRFEALIASGVRYTAERKFLVDTAAPVLRFDGITNGAIELSGAGSQILIGGSVTEENLASVTVGGHPLKIDLKTGKFLKMVTVLPGERFVEVVALDRAGNRTEARLRVLRPGSGPLLTVNIPDGFVTSKSHLTFDLATERASTLFINNVPRVLRGKTYEFLAGLEPGANEFVFRVVDEKGNESVVTRTVVCQKEGPRAVSALKAYQVFGGVELSWAPGAEETVAYYLVKRDPPFSSGAGDKEGRVSVTGKSGYVDVTAQADFVYTYTVRAVDIWGREGTEARVKVSTLGKGEVVAVAGEEATLLFDRLSLKIKKESLKAGTHQTIQAAWVKRNMADSGLLALGEVYQMGPSGLRFEKPAEATISYNASAIPGGYSENEIQIFLRNGPGTPWELCPRVNLDVANHTVTARVAHFSEIVAGFVAAPTESQTRFNVNTKLPEMKIADPLSGLTRMALPAPTASGSLMQSYNIPLPPGVDGMTPSVSLQYDSGRGNGVCGMGWGMPMDGISRDLKKGVPKYTVEDTFLYNGQELVLTEVGDGSESNPRVYRLKREGSFLKFQFITPDGGANGFWKIVQNGVTYTFGAWWALPVPVGHVFGRPVGAPAGGDATFRWNLQKKEKGGQSVFYDYINFGEKQIELSGIYYLMADGAYKFKVLFHYQDRADSQHSAATGLHSVHDKVLKAVSVWDNPAPGVSNCVQMHGFNYQPNVTGDLQLSGVTRYASFVDIETLGMLGTYAYGTGCEVFLDGSTLTFRNEVGDVSPAQMIGNRRADIWGMTASNALDGSGIFWLDKNNEQTIMGKWDRVDLATHRFLGRYLDSGSTPPNLPAEVRLQNGQITFVNGIGEAKSGFAKDPQVAHCSGWNLDAHRSFDGGMIQWRQMDGQLVPTPWSRQGTYFYTESTGTLENTTFNYGGFDYNFSGEKQWNAGNPIPAGYEPFRRKMMDFDGDGLLDMVVDLDSHSEQSPSKRWVLYRNNGQTWGAPQNIGFSGGGVQTLDSTRVQFLNLDRDGKPDLLYDVTGLTAEPGTHFYLFKNMGGSFQYQRDWKISYERSRVSLGDLTGAPVPSVLVSTYGLEISMDRPQVLVYTNIGMDFVAEQGLAQTLKFTSPVAVPAARTTLKDMNGDGKPDFVIDQTSQGQDELIVYYNKGRYEDFSGFSENGRVYHLTGDLAYRRTLQDMNGDGKPDLVVNLYGIEDGKFRVYLNLQDDFDLAHPVVLQGPTAEAGRISWNDVNSDGRPDLMVDLTGVGQDGETEIWLNARTSFKKLPQNFVLPNIGGSGQFYRLSRGDLDGDGRLDFLIDNGGRVQGNGQPYDEGVYSYLARENEAQNLLTSVSSAGMTANFDFGRVNNGLGYPQTVLVGYRAKNAFAFDSVDFRSQAMRFEYDQGKVDRENEVAYGFGEVRAYDAADNRTTTIFNQVSEDLFGTVNLEIKEVKNGAGYARVSTVKHQYEVAGLYPDGQGGFKSHVALQTGVLTTNAALTFDPANPNAQHFQVNRVAYRYYGHGGLSQNAEVDGYFPLAEKINYQVASVLNADPLQDGSDQTPDDNLIENYTYTGPNGAFGIGPQIWATFKVNGLGQWAELTTNFYDNAGPGLLGDKGLVTTKHTWNGLRTLPDETVENYNLVNQFVYDGSGHLTHTVDPKNVTADQTWDPTGRFVVATTTSLGDSSSKTHDPVWGQRLTEADGFGRVSRFEYDDLGRLTAVYAPEDLEGLPSRIQEYGVDPQGAYYSVLKLRKFQNNSGLASGESPFIESIGFVDGLGRELQSRLWKSEGLYIASGRRQYDALGQVTVQYDPVAMTVEACPFRSYAPSPTTSAFSTVSYDGLGRKTLMARGPSVSSVAYPDLYTTETRPTVTEGLEGQLVKVQVKDAYGQVVWNADTVNGAVVAKVSYRYDLRGNLLETRDAAERSIALTYNEISKKIAMSDPDMGNWTYGYDQWGQMTNQVDARGYKSIFTYDIKGNLTNKRFVAGYGDEVDYVYGSDPGDFSKNRLRYLTNDTLDEQYFYNAQGALTNTRQHLDGVFYDTGYFYDQLGRIRDLIYPHVLGSPGYRVRYSYDGPSGLLNRIAKVTVDGEDPNVVLSEDEVFLDNIQYDEMGRRRTVTVGNSALNPIETKYDYEADTGRLSKLSIGIAGGTLYQDYRYGYNARGLLSSKTQLTENFQNFYQYDALGRLTRDEHSRGETPAYDHHFGYDASGNITYKERNVAGDEGNRNYQYNNPLHPHAVTYMQGPYYKNGDSDGSANYYYEHDAVGNTIHSYVTSANFVELHTHYSFNGDNQLTTIFSNRGNDDPTLAYQFAYDASGERVKKVRNEAGNTLTTLYLAGVAQIANGVVTYLIFDGVNRIAAVNDLGGVKKTFFMHTDQVGSTVLVTTGAGPYTPGNVRSGYDYKAFGALFAVWHDPSGTGAGSWTSDFELRGVALSEIGNFTFTGQEQDESGLMYYGARYYDPNLGRFISADSVVDGAEDAQGYNRYGYAGNNPISVSDPSGNWKFGIGIVIGWDSENGLSIGFGVEVDFSIGAVAVQFGMSVTHSFKTNSTTTHMMIGVGFAGVFAGVSYSNNSKNGESLSAYVGFGIKSEEGLNLNFSVTGQWNWNRNREYQGSSVSIGGQAGVEGELMGGFGYRFGFNKAGELDLARSTAYMTGSIGPVSFEINRFGVSVSTRALGYQYDEGEPGVGVIFPHSVNGLLGGPIQAAIDKHHSDMLAHAYVPLTYERTQGYQEWLAEGSPSSVQMPSYQDLFDNFLQELADMRQFVYNTDLENSFKQNQLEDYLNGKQYMQGEFRAAPTPIAQVDSWQGGTSYKYADGAFNGPKGSVRQLNEDGTWTEITPGNTGAGIHGQLASFRDFGLWKIDDWQKHPIMAGLEIAGYVAPIFSFAGIGFSALSSTTRAANIARSLSGSEYIVYRALSAADRASYLAGNGLSGKNINGLWTATEHVLNQSWRLLPGGAKLNSPWISTTARYGTAMAYNAKGGYGIVAIDLRLVSSLQVRVFSYAPRGSFAFMRSFWAREVTIFQNIPQKAIIGFK